MVKFVSKSCYAHILTVMIWTISGINAGTQAYSFLSCLLCLYLFVLVCEQNERERDQRAVTLPKAVDKWETTFFPSRS